MRIPFFIPRMENAVICFPVVLSSLLRRWQSGSGYGGSVTSPGCCPKRKSGSSAGRRLKNALFRGKDVWGRYNGACQQQNRKMLLIKHFPVEYKEGRLGGE